MFKLHSAYHISVREGKVKYKTERINIQKMPKRMKDYEAIKLPLDSAF